MATLLQHSSLPSSDVNLSYDPLIIKTINKRGLVYSYTANISLNMFAARWTHSCLTLWWLVF